MAEGILAVTVFCMFGLDFILQIKQISFGGEIQENTEEKQQSSKILFLNTLSDEELLREIHECKIEYKEAEIIIFDGQSGMKKRILTIIQSHDIIAKTAEKGTGRMSLGIEEDNKKTDEHILVCLSATLQ